MSKSDPLATPELGSDGENHIEFLNLNVLLSTHEEVTSIVESLIVMSSYMGLEKAKVALITAYNEILASRPIPRC